MGLYIRFSFSLVLLLGFAPLGHSALQETPTDIAALREKIRDAATRANLDPLLVEAVVRVESAFSTTARSSKGAAGLMQVMPRTAAEVGITNSHHAVDNLMGASLFLRKMLNRYRGNLKKALAAYNAGPHNVDKHGGIPPFPETQKYVTRVLAHYSRLKATAKAD